MTRARTVGLAVVLTAFLAFAVPAWAAAAEFTVTGTGDGAKGTAGVSCPAAAGNACTLRAAIESVNEAPGADVIKFDPAVFNGEPADTIAPALLPAISTPTTVDGAACNVGSTVPCLTASSGSNELLRFSVGETKAENLSIVVPSGALGIRASGSAGSGTPGIEILDNEISMPGVGNPSTGIEVSLGASGDLIQGNEITSAYGFNYSIALRGNSNRILGNELVGGGCCQAGVTLSLGASGNQIGGDTPASENVIQNFAGGAVQMMNAPTDSSHNEVRRNRGEAGSNFISGASVAEPVITAAKQSSVSGTAKPGATVRVFTKSTESAGEIRGFLAETVADATTGAWKATFAKAPTGTLVAATQTLAGSTSGVGATTSLLEEPEAGGGGGGGQPGGGTTTAPGNAPTGPVITVTPPAPPTSPTVKITSGPKKSSSAVTARFRFKASVSGAKLECKLDRAKWAKCRSPKSYRRLKPGSHAFRVRAVAGGLIGAVTKYQFKIKE